MFKSLFRKKVTENKLIAPVSGKIINIEKVSDPVFAQKMMGDGFAIEIEASDFYALADGKVSVLFPTGHAFGLTLENGLEILVHIGIDTVSENGKGFTCHVKANDTVKAGDKIVSIDRAYLEEQGYDLTTMVIFTNPATYESFSCEYDSQVKGGQDTVATYKLK